MYIVSKLFLESVTKSLLIVPMILLHLFILSSMCCFKSSLESKISSRCFGAGEDCILLLLKVKGSWGTFSRLCEKQTSVAYLVGSGLKFLNVTVNIKKLCNLKTFACFINNKFSKKMQKHLIESISIQKVSLASFRTDWPVIKSVMQNTYSRRCKLNVFKIWKICVSTLANSS